MAYVTGLRCAKCGKLYLPKDRVFTCKEDEGRLDVEYDYDSIAGKASRRVFENRRGGLWKYRELLPIENEENIVSLGEVQTPLIHCKNLGKILGLRNLYVKDETKGPTAMLRILPASARYQHKSWRASHPSLR